MPAFREYFRHPMITHNISSYPIPFISIENYIVRSYNYKSMNLTQLKTYVKGYTDYNIWIKFESSTVQNGLRNAERVQITN